METGTEISKAPAMEFRIDLKYEFCAPHFFDFCIGETEEEAAAAERWFKGSVSDPASPLVGKMKSIQELSTSCSLEEYIEVQKLVARVTPEIPKGMEVEIASDDVGKAVTRAAEVAVMPNKEIGPAFKNTGLLSGLPCEATKEEPCTPKEQFSQHFAELKSIKATHTARNVPSKWNQSELRKQATLNKILQVAPSNRLAAKRCLVGSQNPGMGEETHATKKQKLEGGQSCQVWNARTCQGAATMTVSQQFRLNAEKQACKRQKLDGGGSHQLLHTKTPRPAPTLTVPHEFHFHTEKRAHIHGQCSSEAQAQSSSLPYIPVAEMVQRFQMNILGELRAQSKMTSSRKRSLKLTQPKEPMLGTSLRARPPTVKSFAEQEEEMLANLPRFKARPLNKKILQGPTLPPLPRSTPQLPEFQEFNLRTMERALMYQHALPPMEVSSAIENRERLWSTKREFYFETAARARPPKIKCTEEDLAMLPKFKARPLDKRIFLSRGDVGVFTVPKRQATIPKEFQFATDQRAQHHEAILMEQQNQKQRMLQHNRMDRSTLPMEENESSGSNPQPNTTDLYDSYENYGSQQSAGLSGMGWQTTPTHSSIGLVYPERNRKPLGEIQQRCIFGQTVQQAMVHKTDQENNHHQQDDGPFSYSHLKGALYPPQIQQSEAFPFQIRSTKDFNQHSTPQMGGAVDGQLQKTPFPMYFMR